jgi:guanylate kinase
MTDTLSDVERVIQQNAHHLERLLFVLVGPSGVGKNTIIRELLATHPEMERVRTYTTRKKREDEVDGAQYHFISPQRFLELASAGKLMEADAQKATEILARADLDGLAGFIGIDVYGLGDVYSMPEDLFEEIPPEKHLVIAEVDVNGAELLRRRYPGCVTIFVTAPPLDLIHRIRERPDGEMNSQKLAQRMKTAHEQVRAAKEFDYVVFNRKDRLAGTIEGVNSIVMAERMRVRDGFDLEASLPDDAFDVPDEDRTTIGHNG